MPCSSANATAARSTRSLLRGIRGAVLMVGLDRLTA
jgi:hypothetical protein